MGMKPVNECTNPGIPVPASDALTDVLREGARRMLREAVEAEVQEFLIRHASLKDGNHRQRVVRNGYLPERTIQTGLGDIPSRHPVCGTGRERSGSRPRFFRPTCGAPKAWPNCCRGCTSEGSPRETSVQCSPVCWDKMPGVIRRDDPAPEGVLEGRPPPVGGTWPVQYLRVYLGRRHPF